MQAPCAWRAGVEPAIGAGTLPGVCTPDTGRAIGPRQGDAGPACSRSLQPGSASTVPGLDTLRGWARPSSAPPRLSTPGGRPPARISCARLARGPRAFSFSDQPFSDAQGRAVGELGGCAAISGRSMWRICGWARCAGVLGKAVDTPMCNGDLACISSLRASCCCQRQTGAGCRSGSGCRQHPKEAASLSRPSAGHGNSGARGPLVTPQI